MENATKWLKDDGDLVHVSRKAYDEIKNLSADEPDRVLCIRISGFG